MSIKKLMCLVLAATLMLAAFCACADSKGDKELSKEASNGESTDTSKDTSEEASQEPKEPLYTTDIKNISDYVTLGTYKGVEIEFVRVTDEETESQLKKLIDSEKKLNAVTDRPAKLGDTVVMDYTGYFKDTDKAFEGGAAKDASLELGSGNFIPGFEDGLVGHSVGEEFDIFLTFPEDYHSEEMKGKEVRFAIKLKGISEYIYPEITDELAIKLKFEGADALKQKAKENAEAAVLAANLASAWKKAIDSSKIEKFPEEHYKQVVDEFVNYSMAYYKTMAAQYGMELEVLTGKTEAELKKEFIKSGEEYANTYLKEELIMWAIINDMDAVEISEEEYNTKVQEYADKNGITTDKLKESYTETQIKINIYWDKAKTYVFENAVELKAEDK